MNKTLHRVIFNSHRGQRMAVAESAACAGQGAGAQPDGASQGRPGTLFKPLSLALLLAFGGAVLIEPAHAQSIRADAAGLAALQPGIGQASNGIPLVNIQTPSSAGVSMNQYSQFDVDARGAILNNSSQGAQTQLAGRVQANPNLAQGQARIIVNQVNNANPSQLKGYVEVAGQRAEVIIANPSGIVVNGGKFINAAGVTLSSGLPLIEGGQFKGHQVRGGSIAIEGKGLDTQDADYTRILARAARVNADIKTQDLQIVTGVNDINAQGQVTATWQYDKARPTAAIDTGELGGMYANKITLVSTEKGVGVNNAGQILAGPGGVSIDAQGNLVNSANLTSQGPVSVSTQELENKTQGTIIAGELRVRNQGKLNNQGSISAERLDVVTGQLVNQGNISQTGAAELYVVAARGLISSDEGVIGELLEQVIAETNSSGKSTSATPGQLIVRDDFDNTKGTLAANGGLTLATVSNSDAAQAASTTPAAAKAATSNTTQTATADTTGDPPDWYLKYTSDPMVIDIIKMAIDNTTKPAVPGYVNFPPILGDHCIFENNADCLAQLARVQKLNQSQLMAMQKAINDHNREIDAEQGIVDYKTYQEHVVDPSFVDWNYVYKKMLAGDQFNMSFDMNDPRVTAGLLAAQKKAADWQEQTKQCGLMSEIECRMYYGTISMEEYNAYVAQFYQGGKAAGIGLGPNGGGNPDGTNYCCQDGWGADMLHKEYVHKWELLAYVHTTQPVGGGQLIGIGTNTSSVYQEIVPNPYYIGPPWASPIVQAK